MFVSSFHYKPVGDCAVLVECGDQISEKINRRVMGLYHQVMAADLPGVTEAVPTFASLLLRYDPLIADSKTLIAALKKLARNGNKNGSKQSAERVVEIPVCYGGMYGEDLPFVARHANLTPQQVIALHSGRDYRIYMLGFLPGFPYLGGLDKRLHTPRMDNPRTRIPAGSVGIGGEQTGVYSMQSPGGWRLIGRTPLCLFRPEDNGALPYEAGDSIRFVPIDEETFLHMQNGQKAR